MRLTPRTWFLFSLLLFVAAGLSWQHAENLRLARHPEPAKASATPVKKSMAPVKPGAPLLARAEVVTTNSPAVTAKPTNAHPFRVSNTVATVGQLARMDRAILLRNALIDTALPLNLHLPDHLRSHGDPGSYLVKSDRPLDTVFYAALNSAGAEFISYIPNDAAVVSATPEQADALRKNFLVMPYEPQFKLADKLLALATPNPQATTTNLLSLGVIKSRLGEARKNLEQMGATILGEDSNPFGRTLIVQAAAASITSIAQMRSIFEVETASRRSAMNDLTRARLKIAANTQVATNWLGLTGTNIMVSLNDTGADATHPDFDTRIFGLTNDFDGHGTHVAGIIAGSGSESGTVTVASGSVFPIATNQFRGAAPGAKLFVQGIDTLTGALFSDGLLQENASKTNAFISNNSWGYVGQFGYTLAAASYDAAVRDAQPDVTGSQPMLYVFAAGNDGNGSDDGQNGEADTIGSPAAGKNVVTVGATESPRNITNEVSFDGVATNAIFLGTTDSRSDVAYFSSRGNVGIGVEGDFGRYKPDVVTPGTFIVSTRATNYMDPTNFEFVTFNFIPNQNILPGKTNDYPIQVTDDTVAVIIEVFPNPLSPNPFPTNIPILLDPAPTSTTQPSTFQGYNVVVVTNGLSAGDWVFGIVNPGTNQPLALDIATFLIRTNALGDYFTVLSNLNAGLGPYYRYESGTSMAAPAATGTLALMQEYFETKLNLTNHSPALMKALLINGARTLSGFYDFQVNRGGANDQGWGLVNISNSIPANLTSPTSGSVQFFEQDPTNALTTGQTQTRVLTVDPAAQDFPLRITLVWTDPPGNPAASLKLVNDLDLIVSNNITGDVYIGNNFPSGDVFTIGDTNIAASDIVNNVENVYISTIDDPLDTSYTITVRAKRVNVNAVTAVTNGIAQDYALVISSGNSSLATPFTVDNLTPTPVTEPVSRISIVESGVPLLNQRVGANSPLLTTANGSREQWHFFILTNTFAYTNSSFTNVAFVTFLPPNLSRPRNTDADIDLYCSTNPLLLNLNAAAIAGADKSTNRGGTEALTYTNSQAGVVYYVGVKSEDQQAAEFGFYGIITDHSLSSGGSSDTDPITANALGLPLNIPDGSFDGPSNVMVLAVMPAVTSSGKPFKIRKVSVTDTLFHQNMGDLFGQLTLDGKIPVVLNNHSSSADPVTFLQTLTYDDLPEDPSIISVHPDGPGTLKDYVDQPLGAGVWMLTETDNALTQTGRVDALSITASPQPPTDGQFQITIPPCGTFYDVVRIPDDGTNLTISVRFVSGTGPVSIYLRKGDFPDPNNSATWDAFTNNIAAPGGSLMLGTNGTPPLTPGLWFFAIKNEDCGASVTLDVLIHIDRAIIPDITQTLYNNTPTTLLDDAVTRSTIFVTNHSPIVSVNVGVRIDHPRVSDLALRLVSPQGTSVLLFEDRGGLAATNLGWGSSNYIYTTFTENTNLAHQLIKFATPPFASSNVFGTNNILTGDFETVTNGTYTNGQVVENWLITTNQVGVISNAALANTGTNFLALANGTISRTFATDIGRTYQFTQVYRGDDITNWWPSDGNPLDIINANNGTNSGGLTYLVGEVDRAWKFDGTSSQVTFGTNTANFGTNDFTVEFWIKTSSTRPTEAVMQKRVTCFTSLPLFDIRLGGPTPGTPAWELHNTGPSAQVAFYAATNINNGLWHHLAFTRQKLTHTIYVDGKFSSSALSTAIIDMSNNVPFIVGVSSCTGSDGTENFSGSIDELSIYKRALAQAEVAGIYEGAGAGKVTPVSILPNYSIVLNNTTNSTNSVVAGVGGPWRTNVFSFTAKTNTATIALQGNPLGVLLDKLNLDGLPVTNFNNFYYPEESLDAFIGQNGFGNWTLEVWDTRAGTPVPASLLSWDLDLTFSATNVNLVVLTNGVVYTNVMDANSIMYFGVDAPPLSTHATNMLFALSGGPLNLLYNQSALPTGVLPGDYDLLTGVGALGDTNLLVINSPPPTFLPGERFFLGVQNLTGAPQLISIETQFDVTTNVNATSLTNSIDATNTIFYTNAYQYYSFDIPTNAIQANFELLHPSTNLDLVVRHTVPLPTIQSYDYMSAFTGTNNDIIIVSTNSIYTTNSMPVPLSGGRWYVGVYNAGATNSDYTLHVSYVTLGDYNIIPLTDSVAVSSTSQPGGGTNLYYSFTVTNSPQAVEFDVTNLSGNVDLLARLNALPTPQQSDRGSFNLGTNNERIVFATNSALTNLNGTWYLAVPNNEIFPVTYSIVASNILAGATNFPAISTVGYNAAASTFTLNWNAVSNQTYAIDISTNLPVWTTLTNVTATSATATFTDPDPVNSQTLRFYRLRTVP